MLEKYFNVECECGTIVNTNVYYLEGEEPKPPENFKCLYCKSEDFLIENKWEDNPNLPEDIKILCQEAESLISDCDWKPESKRKWKRKSSS